MEWLRLLPKLGFLPHMAHTLDMCNSLLIRVPGTESHSMPYQVGSDKAGARPMATKPSVR